jgi:hypothetical protein
VCPVRAECLELSLRHWRTIGRYGIWGGLVEAERGAARLEWMGGAAVTTLVRSATRDPGVHSDPGGPRDPAVPTGPGDPQEADLGIVSTWTSVFAS